MRVTENMRDQAAQLAMTRASSRLNEATQVASSGMRVSRPSDDPAAYASQVRKDARIGRLEARITTLDRAQGDVEASESALAAAGELFIRAREIATQYADGSYDAGARANAAKEIEAIREQLRAVANTRGSRGYLFAGTDVDTPPFDAGGQFVAAGGDVEVEIADGLRMAVNSDGQKAFDAPAGRDLFQDLAGLQSALENDDPAAVRGLIDPLSEGHEQLVTARAESGLKLERLRSAAEVSRTALDNVKIARAGESEADATQAYTELATAQSAYERAIAVARHLMQLPSPLDGL
jgi:flagellar hook-associated protein 3 FlgL